MTKENNVHLIFPTISEAIESLRRIQEVAWRIPYHEDSNCSVRSAMSEVDKAIDCLFKAKDHYLNAEYSMGMEIN
jgi:hypothetical protein